MLMMTADILFHRMTEENMNYEWLKSFLDEMKISGRDKAIKFF